MELVRNGGDQKKYLKREERIMREDIRILSEEIILEGENSSSLECAGLLLILIWFS